MSRSSSPPSYDVIVIGGGHNGLIAASYLARKGRKTLLLERRSSLGGLAGGLDGQDEFASCRLDAGSTDVGSLRPAVVRELGLTELGLKTIESPVAAYELTDGLTLWKDPARTAQELEGRNPQDARAFPEYCRQVHQLSSSLDGVLDLTPPPLEASSWPDLWPWLKTALRLKRQGPHVMTEFMRVLPMTAQELLEEWFEDATLKGLLASGGLMGSLLGPQAAGTAFLMLYHSLGWKRAAHGFRALGSPLGGMAELARILGECCRRSGAEIRLDADVSRILVEDGRAVGVELNDGAAIRARCVASSVDPRRTLFDLVGAPRLAPREMRKVRSIRFGGTLARLDLLLDRLPRFGDEEERLSGRIVVSSGLGGLEWASDDAKYGGASERPVLDMTLPSLLDDSRAPTNRHLLSVDFQHLPRAAEIGADREAIKESVLAVLAEFDPDISDAVLAMRLTASSDWERDFNVTGGCSRHGVMDLDQLFLMRPIAGYARYRLPIEGLYLCGAGAHPGGGVTGAPGRNAAREILKDLS